jgi:tripeptidyl-peptidase I
LDNGLAADREVLVSIALKQQNLDELHRLFFQVSDPQSPMYAQYLSLSELRELVAPSMENIKALTNFLLDNGYVLRYLAL